MPFVVAFFLMPIIAGLCFGLRRILKRKGTRFYWMCTLALWGVWAIGLWWMSSINLLVVQNQSRAVLIGSFLSVLYLSGLVRLLVGLAEYQEIPGIENVGIWLGSYVAGLVFSILSFIYVFGVFV